MASWVGTGWTAEQVEWVDGVLESSFADDEGLLALVRIARGGDAEVLACTRHRVFSFDWNDPTRFVMERRWSEVVRVEVARNAVRMWTDEPHPIKLPLTYKSDRGTLNTLLPAIWQAALADAQPQATAAPVENYLVTEDDHGPEEYLLAPDTGYEVAPHWEQLVFGHAVKGKGQAAILEHCAPGEMPEFVIGAGSGSGALAVFKDRCLIVKAGGMTGLMTGAAFGGRITTFFYAQVTGVEYNSGLLNGVLEILTPSYQGSANKDFWRGSTKGRNADSNDPYTLSNTLPLDKFTYASVRHKVDELRRLVAAAHSPVIKLEQPLVAPAPSASAPSLGDKLRELAELRDEGILTDDEFAQQKQRLLDAA